MAARRPRRRGRRSVRAPATCRSPVCTCRGSRRARSITIGWLRSVNWKRMVETFDGEDHTFVTQAASGAFALPDGRQWELATPPDKHGADLFRGLFGVSQAAADGDALIAARQRADELCRVYASTVEVFGRRAALGGWSSQDISPPRVHAANAAQPSAMNSRSSPKISRARRCSQSNARSTRCRRKRSNRQRICAAIT